MMNIVRTMCQHVSTNLQERNSLIQVLQIFFDSQQGIIKKQGHQIKLLGNKLERLMNIVVDKLQEAVKHIKESEYEEDGYGADQSPQHNSPWDIEYSGETAESKEELLQEEIVTTQEVGKHPPLPKREGWGATGTHKIRNTSQ